MALTDPKLRNAEPGDKPFKLYDAGGLFLLVQKNGGKWWRLKYRFAGKEKQLSMGIYPDHWESRLGVSLPEQSPQSDERKHAALCNVPDGVSRAGDCARISGNGINNLK